MTEKKERSEAQKNQLLMAQKKAYEKRKALAEAKQTPEPTEPPTPEPEPEQEPTPPPSPKREPTPPPSPKREPTPPPSPKREPSPPPPPEPVVETQPSLRYERGTLMFYE